MEIKQLKYFIEVAKREHLSEAALELDIAQSAISRQISHLERELNVTLFKREGRNIHLTDDGHKLLAEANKIVEQAEDTVRLFHNQSETNRYVIRIGYVESYTAQMLGLLIQTFEGQSDSKIEPMLMEETEITNTLLADQIDVAFMDLSTDLKQHRDLDTMPLFEETYNICVPKEDPIALATNPPLSQFKDKMIYQLYATSQSIKHTLEQQIQQRVRIITHKQLAKYLLTHNRGFIITPSYHIIDKPNNKWVEISLAHTELKRTICCATRKDNRKHDMALLKNTIITLLSRDATYH